MSVGSSGVFVVDDQFAPLTGKILAAIRDLSDAPIRFVINTHWHSDHTGGNENMGAQGALIVAHENVRARMSADQFMEAFGRRVPASPPAALPVVTFPQSLTFHWNDDTITAIHAANAHTDGDAIVHFAEANVIHMGDTYFAGFYPFIDTGSEGSIDGASMALALADEDTRIIPGHGQVSNRDELRAHQEMLMAVRQGVHALMDDGLTREEVVAAKPTADLDATWRDGFMTPDIFVGLVYDSLQSE